MTDLEKTKKFFKELGIDFKETNEAWGKLLPDGEVRLKIRDCGTNFMKFVDEKFIEIDSYDY